MEWTTEKNTNTEITELSVTINPRRLNDNLGHNYEVSLPLKVLIPLATIRSAQPNTYKKLWCMFILQDLREFNPGDNGNEVWKIMAVLNLKGYI